MGTEVILGRLYILITIDLIICLCGPQAGTEMNILWRTARVQPHTGKVLANV